MKIKIVSNTHQVCSRKPSRKKSNFIYLINFRSQESSFFARVCLKKTNKISPEKENKFKDTPKVMNTLKFAKQDDPAISSELRPDSLSKQEIQRVHSWDDDENQEMSTQKKTKIPKGMGLKSPTGKSNLNIESVEQSNNNSMVGLKSMVVSPDAKHKKSSTIVDSDKKNMIENFNNSNADFDLSKIGKNINKIEDSLQNESNINILQKSNVSQIKKSTNSLSKSKGLIKNDDSNK